MNAEEIRKKAIEYAKATPIKKCCHPCYECEYGEYFLERDFSCLTVNGYEHGFADGVEEGKKEAIADLAEHDKSIKNQTIAPFEREIANLNRVDWTEQNLAIFAMNISGIIEQMEGEKHDV